MKKLNNYLSNLLKNDFTKGVTILSLGSIATQAISFFLSLIVAKFFFPQDFALFALLSTYATTFSLFCGLRLEQTLLLSTNSKQLTSNLHSALLTTLLMTTLGVVLCFLFFLFLNITLNYTLVPLWGGSLTISSIQTNLSIRKSFFKKTIVFRILGSLLPYCFVLLFYHLDIKDKLMISMATGAIVVGAISLIDIFVDLKNNSLPSIHTLLFSFRENRELIKSNLPQAALDNFKNIFIVTSIGHFWGATALGCYAFIMRILLGPVTLLGYSFSQMFCRHMSDLKETPFDVKIFFNVFFKRLIVFTTCFLVLIIICFSLGIFNVIGRQWLTATPYAIALAPWASLIIIASTLSHTPLVFNKQSKSLQLAMIGTFFSLSTLIVSGISKLPFIYFLIIFSGVNCLYLVLVVFWYYTTVQQFAKNDEEK